MSIAVKYQICNKSSTFYITFSRSAGCKPSTLLDCKQWGFKKYFLKHKRKNF